jgi:hypothetical protein
MDSSGNSGGGAMSKNPELRLQIKSDWGEMDRVYRVVNNFLKSHLLSDDFVNMCTMIVCELVENGIKYGSFSGKGGKVEIFMTLAQNKFSVQVTSPLEKVPDPNLNELDHTIQWIRGFQDPFQAYIERMMEISREPLENARSGLGIVRISREGHAVLDFIVDENKTLVVSAISDIK